MVTLEDVLRAFLGEMPDDVDPRCPVPGQPLEPPVAELTPVLIIVVLLALNALFVAAEFAIVGVPRTSIDRRAQQGNRIARMVQGVLKDTRRQDRSNTKRNQ